MLSKILHKGGQVLDFASRLIEAAGSASAWPGRSEGVRVRADIVCGTTVEDGVRQVSERFVLRSQPGHLDRGRGRAARY